MPATPALGAIGACRQRLRAPLRFQCTRSHTQEPLSNDGSGRRFSSHAAQRRAPLAKRHVAPTPVPVRPYGAPKGSKSATSHMALDEVMPNRPGQPWRRQPSSKELLQMLHDRFKQEAEARREPFPSFRTGDELRIEYRTSLKDPEAPVEIFEGLCLDKRDRGYSTTFVLRTRLDGETFERVIPLYSPFLQSLKIVRRFRLNTPELYIMREFPEQEHPFVEYGVRGKMVDLVRTGVVDPKVDTIQGDAADADERLEADEARWRERERLEARARKAAEFDVELSVDELQAAIQQASAAVAPPAPAAEEEASMESTA